MLTLSYLCLDFQACAKTVIAVLLFSHPGKRILSLLENVSGYRAFYVSVGGADGSESSSRFLLEVP